VRAATDRFREREFRPADMDALLLIEADAGQAAWTRQVFQDFLRHPGTRMRVITTAAAHQAPIAFYAVQRNSDEIYLANLAVAPSWRRQAVATFALESLTSWCRQRGMRRITLHVQEQNLGAQILYRENGFLAVDIIHRHYGAQDGYVMRKEL
jgi:ribosomal-protein-alanine N-acetyltransferase